MLLHVLEDVLVGPDDAEAVPEHLDERADVHVLRAVVHQLVGVAAGLGHARPLQELAADDPRVSDRRFVDCHHVVGQSV